MSLTMQQVFDNALRGVIAQGGFSKANFCCRYRTDDDRKCGIGHSIPDSLYSDGIEGLTAADLKLRDGFFELFAGLDADFLKAVQLSHDAASDMNGFRNRMREVALRYSLTYTEPEAS